jgi:hypothetical protein
VVVLTSKILVDCGEFGLQVIAVQDDALDFGELQKF